MKSRLVAKKVYRTDSAVNLEGRERLAEVIKKARGHRSQRAYGRLIGVSGTAVGLWEEMESVPDMGNLERIAASAGFSLKELTDYLNGKPAVEPGELEQLVRQILYMPERDFAQVVRAVGDRLASVAEGAGQYKAG